MTAPRDITVTASCRCGATVSIQTESITVAESVLRMWNGLHASHDVVTVQEART